MCMWLLICFQVEATWDICDSVQVTYSAVALRDGNDHTRF